MTTIQDNIDSAKARLGNRSDKETGAGRPRLSDEEKAARQVKRDVENAAKEVARAAKRAENAAKRGTPHMKKVEKAIARLPKLEAAAQRTFDELTASFGNADIAALAAHLSMFNRLQSTKRAGNMQVESGQQVRIVGGEARFIGELGTVGKVSRIRAHVVLESNGKTAYCFISDLEVMGAATQSRTA
jgi:hypothetical protein